MQICSTSAPIGDQTPPSCFELVQLFSVFGRSYLCRNPLVVVSLVWVGNLDPNWNLLFELAFFGPCIWWASWPTYTLLMKPSYWLKKRHCKNVKYFFLVVNCELHLGNPKNFAPIVLKIIRSYNFSVWYFNFTIMTKKS